MAQQQQNPITMLDPKWQGILHHDQRIICCTCCYNGFSTDRLIQVTGFLYATLNNKKFFPAVRA